MLFEYLLKHRRACLAAIGLVAAAALVAMGGRYVSRPIEDGQAAHAGSAAAAASGVSLEGKGTAFPWHVTGASPFSPASPLETVKPPQFRADASGHLVVDDRARNDIERIYALYQGPHLLAKLQEFSARLPLQAQQDLRDLYQHYVQYSDALAQSMAARQDGDDASLEGAEREMQTLHDLRQTYFGADRAAAMFGNDEQVAREIHQYMRDHTDPGLPLSERAELAQAAWWKAKSAQAPAASIPGP